MICAHCDAPMPDISVFCPACGRSTATGGFDPASSLDRALSPLAYIGLVPAIVFLLVPALRAKRLVRFHSWQSVFFFVSVVVLAGVFRLLFLVFSVLPVIGFLTAWLLLGIGCLGITILWLVILIKAAQGQYFKLPPIGGWAARLSSTLDSAASHIDSSRLSASQSNVP